MKIRTIVAITSITLATGGAGLRAGTGAVGFMPPDSHAFGKTLAEWGNSWWQWSLAGPYPSAGKVGHVQLLPFSKLEMLSGTGTPEDPLVLAGEMEYMLKPGTPFVLVAANYYRELYQDGSIHLPMTEALQLEDVNLVITIDGETVVSEANEAAFYVPETRFDPIIFYPTPTFYGSVAALYFQGFCFVHPPLQPGRHLMHLHVSWNIPAGVQPNIPDGQGSIGDANWTITVSPK
jgi:hypothetical protein